MIPKISVVMSVYNGEKYLDEAVQSILEQTFSNFEFIIINDGSTDKSLSIIHHYSSQDKRIVVINQENKGLTKSLNKGIHVSKGEYIARMDADDVSLSQRFSTQLPWLEEDNFALCCSRTWLIQENRVSPRMKYYLPKKWLLKFGNPFIHGTFLIRKSSLEKIGYYNEEFRYAQDYKLITDFYNSKFKVKYLKEVLYKTRIHNESIGYKYLNEQTKNAQLLKWWL